MNKLIILCGKSATGKSTLEKMLLEDMSIRRLISYTTRLPRSSETEGVDYIFIDNNEFDMMKEYNLFLETTEYEMITDKGNRKVQYGTHKDDLNLDVSSYVCVLNPEGARQMKDKLGDRVVSVEILREKEDRLDSAYNREEGVNADEILRRFKADDTDFEDFYTDYSIMNTDLDKSLKLLEMIIESECR